MKIILGLVVLISVFGCSPSDEVGRYIISRPTSERGHNNVILLDTKTGESYSLQKEPNVWDAKSSWKKIENDNLDN
jgi:hypothetical protein